MFPPQVQDQTFVRPDPIYFQAQAMIDRGPETTVDKIKRISYLVFSILFFPTGIASLVKKGAHRLASYLIVPSQLRKDPNHAFYRDVLIADYQAKPLEIETEDGIKLSAMHIPGRNKGKCADQAAPTIIYFNSNAQLYEDFAASDLIVGSRVVGSREGATMSCSPLREWVDAGYNVVLFNYRGVGESAGHPSREGLCLDGEAVYQYVEQELVVEDQSILLWGQCLGGAVATEVAARHRKAQLCNSRSFSSLSQEARHLMGIPLLNYVIRLIGWEYAVADLWQKVQGEKLVVYHPEDDVIPAPVSLISALKAKGVAARELALKNEAEAIKERLNSYETSCGLDLLSAEEEQKVRDQLKDLHKNAHKRPLTPTEIQGILSSF
ncbi:MAG: putative dienelactone hydrolase [Chlamydiales bacterium]|nr:putative dienelactone hydrolase [Chlamydiales bacterium]